MSVTVILLLGHSRAKFYTHFPDVQKAAVMAMALRMEPYDHNNTDGRS
jgi:hypothetical protein